MSRAPIAASVACLRCHCACCSMRTTPRLLVGGAYRRRVPASRFKFPGPGVSLQLQVLQDTGPGIVSAGASTSSLQVGAAMGPPSAAAAAVIIIMPA